MPFAYESTGAATQFTTSLESDFRSREVFTFHRPEELIRPPGSTAGARRPAGDARAQYRPDFKQFLTEHKDEIEAIKLLHSKPYRAGLRYRLVKDLAPKLNRALLGINPDDKEERRHRRLWGHVWRWRATR